MFLDLRGALKLTLRQADFQSMESRGSMIGKLRVY